MKKLFVLGLALLALTPAAKATDSNQEAYYSISNVQFKEVAPSHEELYMSQDFFEANVVLNPTEIAGRLDQASIILDKLVLVGKKVIDIIKAGAPVINIQRDAVHVVPQGITAWQQLAGWRTPVTKVFEVSFKNKLNMNVITTRLKLSAATGGTYNGTGRYLSNVHIVPTYVNAAWGFKLDVWLENQQPLNIGSVANPVAGLGIDLRYRVGAVVPLQATTGGQDYFVRGDGVLQTL